MVGGAYAPRHRWRRSIQHARLPSHSQAYCSTHERPGTWRSSPRDQYWSLAVTSPKENQRRGPPQQAGRPRDLPDLQPPKIQASRPPPLPQNLAETYQKTSQTHPQSQRPTNFPFSFTHHQQKVARPPLDLFQALRTFSVHK